MSNDNFLSRSSKDPRWLLYAKVGVAVVAAAVVCIVLLKLFSALAPLIQVLFMTLVGFGMWTIFHRLASIEKQLDNQNHLLTEIFARLRGPSDPSTRP